MLRPPVVVDGQKGRRSRGRWRAPVGLASIFFPTIPPFPLLQTSAVATEAKELYNTTKQGVNRVLEYLKNEPQIAEGNRLAAKPPKAVLAEWKASKDAVDAAFDAVPGTSGTVGDAAVSYDGAPKSGAAPTTARTSDVDVFSAGEMGAAAATGALQNLADGFIAASAAGKTDALATAVGKVIASSANATVEGTVEGEPSPAVNLGAAFGLALREAPTAFVAKVGAPGVPLRANVSSLADAFVAGMEEAVIPCAATAGDGVVAVGEPLWFKSAARRCCSVVTPALRAAQAAVDGDSLATRALYISLTSSFELGGQGSFSLARCSTPNAKELDFFWGSESMCAKKRAGARLYLSQRIFFFQMSK